MNKERIIKILNEDISLEIGAIIQYMHHHFTAEGMESPEIIDKFEETAEDEMKHMALLSERVNYLGGDPSTAVAPFKKGGDLKKMIQDDLDGENLAIKTYRGHIKICMEEEDPTTRLMLENILSEEEGHADLWETTLGIRK